MLKLKLLLKQNVYTRTSAIFVYSFIYINIIYPNHLHSHHQKCWIDGWFFYWRRIAQCTSFTKKTNKTKQNRRTHTCSMWCSKYICCYTHSEQRKPSGLIRSWRDFTLWWHGKSIPITTSPGAQAPHACWAELHTSISALMLLSIMRAERRLNSRQHLCILNSEGGKNTSGFLQRHFVLSQVMSGRC